MIRLSDVERTPEEIAALAKLRHVGHEEPGLLRRRCGRGFTYLTPDGTTLQGPERARCEALALPPAWSDVWICADADGHLQGVGIDEAGRRQYRYHDDFRAEAERVKYLRLGPFGSALDHLRRTVAKDLLGEPGSARRVTAALVRLVDLGLLRVGSVEPEDVEDAVGATTLPPESVELDLQQGIVELEYVAKGGQPQEQTIEDPALAHVLAASLELDGPTAFVFDEGDGPVPVTSERVNRYLAEVTAQRFTAKDFRTWGGSVTVAETLAQAGRGASDAECDTAVLEAIDAAADRLGNTREVARASYVSPTVIDAFRSGELDRQWARTRTGRWSSRAERTVTRLHADLDVASLRSLA